jgi:hypothetical protein
LVQTRDRPGDGAAVIGVELHDHTNGKPSKLSETPSGTQKLKALDDASVQFDQFVFGQRRNVWEHRGAQHTTRLQAWSSAARPMTTGLIECWRAVVSPATRVHQGVVREFVYRFVRHDSPAS